MNVSSVSCTPAVKKQSKGLTFAVCVEQGTCLGDLMTGQILDANNRLFLHLSVHHLVTHTHISPKKILKHPAYT